MIKKLLFIVIGVFTLLLLGCNKISMEGKTNKIETGIDDSKFENTIGTESTKTIKKDSSDTEFKIEDAERVTIFYGVSSYAMDSTDEGILNTLINEFNNLTFEVTDEQIDYGTELRVIFSNSENGIVFNVDKKGVFIFDGKPYDYYKVSSGSFNYELVKEIYRKSSLGKGISFPNKFSSFN